MIHGQLTEPGFDISLDGRVFQVQVISALKSQVDIQVVVNCGLIDGDQVRGESAVVDIHGVCIDLAQRQAVVVGTAAKIDIQSLQACRSIARDGDRVTEANQVHRQVDRTCDRGRVRGQILAVDPKHRSGVSRQHDLRGGVRNIERVIGLRNRRIDVVERYCGAADIHRDEIRKKLSWLQHFKT